MVNWTYIWTNYDATQPEVKKDLGFARYPAVHAGRGVPPAVRRHRRRRERVLPAQGRGDEGDRVHHLARQPGRERRAHRQHAGQRRRLQVPGAGQDLPGSRFSPCSRRASTRRLHARSRRTGATSQAHSRAPGTRRTAWTTRPRRTRSSSSRTCCTEGASCEHREHAHGGEGERDAESAEEARHRPGARREPARPTTGSTGRHRDAGRHGVADDPGPVPLVVPLPAHVPGRQGVRRPRQLRDGAHGLAVLAGHLEHAC